MGEFLKELRLTEGRRTGIPTILRAMRDNGSPEPSFESDEIRSFFTTRLPIHPLAGTAKPPGSDKAGEQVSDEVSAQADVPDDVVALVSETHPRSILKLAQQPRTRAELQDETGIGNAPYLLRRYIKPLLEAGLLAYTIPESPRAPNQKYRTTALGVRLLREVRGS